MKKLTFILFIFLLSLSAFGFAEENDLRPQTVCPVMGGKIDSDVSVDYHGQRIYFCCLSCKEEFQKDPEKYMKVLADRGVLLESVQEFCPVMTAHDVPCFVDNKIYSDYKGRRVYFCSADCRKTFLEDPEKYLEYLDSEDIQK